MSEQLVPAQFINDFIRELPVNSTLRHASLHQQAVSAFCDECGKHSPMQGISHQLTNRLTKEQAVLRAKLQLEEVMEMIRGLGVKVTLADGVPALTDIAEKGTDVLHFEATGTVNMTEIIDGLVDQSVIAMGTASLLGIPVNAFTQVVDENNVAKFGLGHYFREDGKLVKPEGHPKPDLAAVVTEISGKNLDTDFAPYNWSDVE